MGKLTMTRRTFAKMTAATAAAVGIAGIGTALAESSASSTSTGEVKRIRSTCRGCGKTECGVWVYVQDGKVIRSEGDEAAFQSMGNHCSKGQASLQAAYHPDRLKYPMKRTNPKCNPSWADAASIYKTIESGQPYCDGETDDEKWPIDDAENR